MLNHYLKLALRSLVNNKAYSLINISGLAIGMCACLLILQYVSYELSFDSFHEKRADIYRVRNDRQAKGELVQKGVATYPFIGPGLKQDFPEIINYVRIAPWIADHTLLTYGEKVFREREFLFAEPSVFNIFSFSLLNGNAATALKEPRSIALSETKAKQIFGNEDPMGKAIMFENKIPFTVTGIFKDVPSNSHIKFDLLASYETIVSIMSDYGNSKTFSEEVYTYLQLAPKTDINKFNLKLKTFSDKHYEGTKVTGMEETFSLQPLSSIHLNSHFQRELQPNGKLFAVWGLLGVAVLIIIIAWCNYINLSTSHYTKRLKEIGVKKIFGVTKKQFLVQFLIESLTLSIISFLIALSLVYLLQPFFAKLLNLDPLVINNNIYNIPTWLAAFGVFILGAVISSFYPSFILSALKPVSIFKGKLNTSPSIIMFNKSLVVYQFSITIALISFTWLVSKQLNYMTEKDLGVNIDGTLVVWGPMGIKWEGLETKMNAFQNEVSQLPGVKGVASSKNVPGDQLTKTQDVKLKGSNKTQTLASTWVSPDFFDVYNMEILAGRKFLLQDTGSRLVLNNSAVRLLGFNDVKGVIGKKVLLWGDEGEVVGVVNDHHQQSMHNLVEPIVFTHAAGQDGYFSIKVSEQNLNQTIAHIQSTYTNFFKGTSFKYFFLEESFEKQYQNDQLVSNVLRYFSMLAIFISCLGLLGLIIHSITTRIKEIGIRKVLGATVSNIVLLVSLDFIKLILLASLFATPLAWWAMNKWLQDFAYRTNIDWWVFVLAGVVALMIALLTVSATAIKAALANPVKSLRTE
jgi:putative ABC transport system permease protein